MNGRFAPSPTGRLHIGNLRTALVAWLFARSTTSSFVIRMDDLDAMVSRPEHEAGQLADLADLGLDWDGPAVRQSQRRPLYQAALERLDTYPCYCTRREVLEAPSAPHGPVGAYPGTCRSLNAQQRRAFEAGGRRPALRLRSDRPMITVHDDLRGDFTAEVDDLVLLRNDATVAYNLAVVVDDDDQVVDQVVRGDDLLASTPRQAHLATLLGLPVPRYAHVPLILGPDGSRLAKRHGAVSLDDAGGPDAVRAQLAISLNLAERGEAVSMATLLERFDPAVLPTAPSVWADAELRNADEPPLA